MGDMMGSSSSGGGSEDPSGSGGGRWEKALKKGTWTPEEDKILVKYVNKYGEGNWSDIEKNSGLSRNRTSCRFRWLNQLRPGIRKGSFSAHEEERIRKLHAQHGNKWSTIARYLHGRTENDVKNYWYNNLRSKRQCYSTPSSSSAPLVPSFDPTALHSPLLAPNPFTISPVSQHTPHTPLHDPFQYDLGNFELGLATSHSVNTELPSSQLLAEKGGDGGGKGGAADAEAVEAVERVHQLHAQHGNKWSHIAQELHGRTNDDIKNYCNQQMRSKRQRHLTPSSSSAPSLSFFDPNDFRSPALTANPFIISSVSPHTPHTTPPDPFNFELGPATSHSLNKELPSTQLSDEKGSDGGGKGN